MAAGDRHLLLVNPSAGRGRASELLGRIEAGLERAGVPHRTVLTTGIEHGIDEARAAAAAGEIPIVVSGDGLIGQVGGALAETSTPMAVIPGGRGNDFARVVGIPTDPEAAIAVIAAGATTAVDVGVVNGKRFLCIASCGFDSDANRIANETKRIKGHLVYAYAALRALAAWKPATFTITLDGQRHEATGYTVAVANSKAYGGGMIAAPNAILDDGLFDVGATGNVSKLRFLSGIGKVFKGEHLDALRVQTWRAATVRIEADRPFAVYADGDHLADLPADLSLLPQALRVVVPG